MIEIDMNKRIKEALDSYISEQERQDVNSFEEFYNELDESRKSHIVKILLGKGIITKDEKTGKISKGDPEKVKAALNKVGVK